MKFGILVQVCTFLTFFSLREALCVVGNGLYATRGAAEESCADGTHYPATYLAGAFNRLSM